LRRAVELRGDPAGRHRVRPQAAHRPVGLQQGFLLPERFLSVLRDGARSEVEEAEPLKRKADPLDGVPEAPVFALDDSREEWAAVIDGIGGTGVVTIGAILGMAAHLEGKGVGIIDMAGLAQKGGAVFTHMRIGRTPEAVSTIRVSPGKADMVLGGDIVVTGSRKVLGTIRKDDTLVVVNKAEIMPGDFARHREYRLPTEALVEALRKAAGKKRLHLIDAAKRRRGDLRQHDCGQHVHARLRRPAGRIAGFDWRDRGSDPAQWPGGGDECRRVSVGPPRGA
jgi:Pyruvate/2-oxoacid:ferredoxin oxidoreductase gamma subunit